MTGSYFARRSSETAEMVAITRNYSRAGEDARRSIAKTYGLFTSGALKYFSIGISKYISSLPFASCTPIR